MQISLVHIVTYQQIDGSRLENVLSSQEVEAKHLGDEGFLFFVLARMATKSRHELGSERDGLGLGDRAWVADEQPDRVGGRGGTV